MRIWLQQNQRRMWKPCLLLICLGFGVVASTAGLLLEDTAYQEAALPVGFGVMGLFLACSLVWYWREQMLCRWHDSRVLCPEHGTLVLAILSSKQLQELTCKDPSGYRLMRYEQVDEGLGLYRDMATGKVRGPWCIDRWRYVEEAG